MCTVFLIIFSDILVGDPSNPDGLIAEIFPSLGPESPFLNRSYVLAALLLLLLPISLSRNLASLGFLNAVGVGSVVAFALSTSIVAGTAIYQVSLNQSCCIIYFKIGCGGKITTRIGTYGHQYLPS